MTLTEFLKARIAEDERWENEAQENAASLMIEGDIGVDEPWRLMILKRGQPWVMADPRRVLAECEVKRQIIEAHERLWPDPDDGPICRTCDGGGGTFYWPCDTLQFLASPYAAHPEYPS